MARYESKSRREKQRSALFLPEVLRNLLLNEHADPLDSIAAGRLPHIKLDSHKPVVAQAPLPPAQPCSCILDACL